MLRSFPLLLVAVLAALSAACGGDSTQAPDTLYLRVTSDATRDNERIGTLRILLNRGDTVYPLDLSDAAFNPALGDLDPRLGPVTLRVGYQGATFGAGDDVRLEVTGRSGTTPGGPILVRAETNIDLGTIGFIDVRLRAVPEACDADNDGFLDCSINGCCANDSPFGDCGPADDAVNPWASEPACVPCTNAVDSDCRNGPPACVDADQDTVADCTESECGLGDPDVAPGLPEVCDNKDNNCVGGVDEGLTFTYRNETLAKGDPCGVGVCAGGSVVCGNDGGLRCDGEDRRQQTEDCDNELDDDCDGVVNQGCELGDSDEDGFTVAEGDCNDDDRDINPDADEVCDGIDNNCNDSTDENFKAGFEGGVTLTGATLPADNGKTLGQACGTGFCGTGQVVCGADKLTLLCDTPRDPTPTELCDNVDNDCNGGTDEPFVAGGSSPLANSPFADDNGRFKGQSCGTGPCGNGTIVCGSTTTLVCSTAVNASAEICDGNDNDCDGSRDEGFSNLDGDNLPDCIDPDADGDGVPNTSDNCPTTPNANQANLDNDAAGDACDNDIDGDSVLNAADNCPTTSNANQSNLDGDALGDACDTCTDFDNDGWGADGTNRSECPNGATPDCNDLQGNTDDPDADNICGSNDNCPTVANPAQTNTDPDALGDACDPCIDVDGDGFGQADTNRAQCSGGTAVDCDDTANNTADPDADNICGSNDNCPAVANSSQTNSDADAFGDACDACIDADGDGWGRGGTDPTQCLNGPAVDCDDTVGNSADPDTDNVCGSNDNCPSTANANQTNTDPDALGDACDPCIDVDGDGWGRGGTNPALCLNGATVDCDDTADNVADPDFDNICGSNDNCPAIANANQANLDGDPFGDVCDPCIDVDGDGWGRGGTSVAQCPNGAAVDCDDTPGNTADPDADNVCNPLDNCPTVANADQADEDEDGVGDACTDQCEADVDEDGICDVGAPGRCTGGNVLDCNDNCPARANAGQHDEDSDGHGNACDEPFEVCADCLDNDVNGATDGAGCVERRIVLVGAGDEDVPLGHPVAFTFDHAFLVAAGRSVASGDDVRVFFIDPDTDEWIELDRIIDPLYTWNTNYTTVWFAAQRDVPADLADTNYRIVTSGTVPDGLMPMADVSTIYEVRDDFARTNAAALGGNWTETETSGHTVQIASGALQTTADNDDMRPIATLPFDALGSGQFYWRIGWNWVRDDEGTWAVLFQLGHSGDAGWTNAPAALADRNGGVGVNMVWAGNLLGATSGQSLMFADNASNAVGTSFGVVNAYTDLWVHVDLDNDRFRVFPSSGQAQWSAWVTFRNAVTQLNRMRFIAHGVTSTNFTSRNIEYVAIQPATASGSEPYSFTGLEEPNACAMQGTPTAQYWFDDTLPASQAADSASGTPAAYLDVTTGTGGGAGQPAFGDILGLSYLGFSVQQSSGQASVPMFGENRGSKLRTALDGSTQATLEIAFELFSQPSANTVTLMGVSEDNRREFSLAVLPPASAGAAPRIAFFAEDNQRATYLLDVRAAGRTVLHAVYDTSLTPRYRLYRNGFELTAIATPSTGVNSLNINNSNSTLRIGNVTANNETPRGWIHYAAVYGSALSATQIRNNAAVLMADDDKP
jgi:hypothetical protein